MELKEQIEKLEKDFNNRIQELKQQINKPKIEVGKVYRRLNGALVMFTSLDGGYGFNSEGDYYEDNNEWGDINTTDWTEATPEEWTTALTKYADELYKDCDRVDRSGLYDLSFNPIIGKFEDNYSPELEKSGVFQYKGVIVMDSNGNFAKGLKAEVKDMFVNVYKSINGIIRQSVTFYDVNEAKETISQDMNGTEYLGTFKLVPVD